MAPEESEDDTTDRPVEIITIKEEPVEEECFLSAAGYPGEDNYRRNNRRLNEGPYSTVISQRQHNSLTCTTTSVYGNTSSIRNTGSSSTAQTNTQTNPQPNTQTTTQTDTQTTTQTVFKSYSLANIPKFGENGRVLTLGQRLALIKKKQEEEEGRDVSPSRLSSVISTEGEATPSTADVGTRAESDHMTSSGLVATAQDRLATFSGLKYQIAMKVLVPEEVNQIMSRRGKEYYTQNGLRILRFTRNHYPIYNECQIYIKGDPKQVLECLVLIADDLRKHCERGRNRKTREEMMFLVLPAMITTELLRHRKGKRVVRHIEEDNGVWVQLDDSAVQGECVISVTGHEKQMRSGLRQLLEEVVTSSQAETLPSLFYYIPSPRYRQHHSTYQGTYHGTYHDRYGHGYNVEHSDDRGFSTGTGTGIGTPAWLPCDRQEFHRWNTHGDYRF